MLYTLGFKEGYDSKFEEDGSDPIKVGRIPEKDYSGGCVFYTKDKARAHCPEDYDVYGLEATKEDVQPNPKKSWDNLINDSPIVKLEDGRDYR